MTDENSELPPHRDALRVIIYQNADFVGGLLQSLTGQGIAHRGDTTFMDGTEQARNRGGGVEGGVSASGSIPGTVKVDAKIGGKRDGSSSNSETHSRQVRLDVSYDLALHLHNLEQQLGATVRSIESAESDLVGGEIVRFSGRFQPDPVSALLDIVGADLAAEIARFAVRQSRPQVTDDNYDIDRIRAQWEEVEQRATSRSELVRAAAAALHTDFRRSTTIEFQCPIVDEQMTGVVICENEHFVTADSDRLLDGEFTVLGKVVTPPETDVSILRKNKFLRRLSPGVLEYAFDQLDKAVHDSTTPANLPEPLRTHLGGLPPIDLRFPAVIKGKSFTVLPIAIYA